MTTDANQMQAKGNGSILRTPQVRDWNYGFDLVYSEMMMTYRRSKRPVNVNFRQIVPFHSGVDRATHLFHSYPAKLLLNIPFFFLNCTNLSRRGGRVLDPFCGTGTVLLEALLAGRHACGADANPLARLIAQAKVTLLDESAILVAHAAIQAGWREAKPIAFTPVVNVNSWFSPEAQEHLGRLLGAIRTLTDRPIRRFMEVCFSSCLRRASFADPRLSVPVRIKAKASEQEQNRSAMRIAELFDRAVMLNARRLQSLAAVDRHLLDAVRILDDARHVGSALDRPGPETDLIITSPPYVGAQKYIRASSLSIGWLGLAPENKLRNLERLNIGREHFWKSEYVEPRQSGVPTALPVLDRIRSINPLRAHIATTYLSELRVALQAACTQLRRGGYFVLVVGENSVCGAPFPTPQYAQEILTECGLALKLALIDDIRSRGLMTKRNKTAGIIGREHILVFHKR